MIRPSREPGYAPASVAQDLLLHPWLLGLTWPEGYAQRVAEQLDTARSPGTRTAVAQLPGPAEG